MITFHFWFASLPGSMSGVSFCSRGFETPILDLAVLQE